ncbi:ABC1 kinase family protein [Nocardia seriolae]|uniref:Atypical kinase COQ8, mitochondrial n=2 Tax=Nocardia seriolae TaxID=37332 RepID=A0A0B8NLY6_9NOCA|nr:AarF/ABC1/UbiB kinase family protein [Nocardia seriolae]APB00068.1 Atypical kinase COQ8, mitochondrial [Nocardia seriolae]MTJ64744.1 AarF/ABC1/UbiB kinase family protein [Nocardia seriolae]MTJ74169.1 AarF/ABC1/UbiB kinase family protein [Nocardia seriolae]MTJ89584.1 AarF/ABC1/UbiB kinase family protein [Nocardia seriolae]MTK33558.1 AarF/ABC1/UbiB kinase family protein [Nocardia seriolae]
MVDIDSGRAGKVIRFPGRTRRATGMPPTTRIGRDAKLATVPVAYAGRWVAGRGRRLMGASAAEVEHDIQLRTAEHLADVLGELRGCAAKLGQLAGLFRAAIPFEAAEVAGRALSRLQDSAPPMMPILVHGALERGFGPEWRRLFREFEDRPAAAASLGQVHRAVWHDGGAVAVKVMYPGAREAVAADLSHLRGLSGVLRALMPGADVDAVIATVCAMVGDELDYRRVAGYQQRCADAFAGDPDFLVPAVIEVADEVLISEWVDGRPLTRLVESGPPAELSRVGLGVFRMLEAMARRCGVLYADVHPGNFFVLPDGRIAAVDFGACDKYPDNFLTMLIDIGDAVYNGGPAELDVALRRHGFVAAGQEFDVEELIRVVEPFKRIPLQPDFRMTSSWLREQVTAIATVRLSNVFRQMTLPPDLTTFARKVASCIALLSLFEIEHLSRELPVWWPEVSAAVRRDEETVAPRAAGLP